MDHLNGYDPATFAMLVPSDDVAFDHHVLWSYLCSVSLVKMEVVGLLIRVYLIAITI